MSTKSEREYERRRYEKWQERQAKARARRHRQRVIAGSIVGALVLATGVVAALALTNDDTPAAAPTQSAPAPDAGQVPDPSLAEGRTWTGTLALSQGEIGIELDGAAAPQAVANFVSLAGDGFFASTKCHRLTEEGIFVLQCGDPTALGTADPTTGGTGGPGYSWGPIENAPTDDVYPAGTIAMARTGDDGSSMGSQFFLVYKDSPIPADAAGGYTVFGQITSGMDVLQAIADAGTVEGTTVPVSDVIIEGVNIQ
ncbi:peptidylprolyl isomerase [Cellulomonas fengjieae]|uniref:peptidylprolyl isomerase n=1 Tax=Cellulomonas fengjieae TaxID=2819978 RepID=A0ABS3SID6_9CELL|nr:peptidylprolyl isomerase [Cellulomonas fengjieae]MBO3085507.1 peptidylprolyl isomerase [Cellulomonas fengjieae]QVI64449.1 peptidylprolyl isomerase [Cellulomonas fengjieae]